MLDKSYTTAVVTKSYSEMKCWKYYLYQYIITSRWHVCIMLTYFND